MWSVVVLVEDSVVVLLLLLLTRAGDGICKERERRVSSPPIHEGSMSSLLLPGTSWPWKMRGLQPSSWRTTSKIGRKCEAVVGVHCLVSLPHSPSGLSRTTCSLFSSRWPKSKPGKMRLVGWLRVLHSNTDSWCFQAALLERQHSVLVLEQMELDKAVSK